MEITIIGYLIIPIGIFLLFIKPTWLLYLAIIFFGFSGTAILIFGGDLGIQPSYYFAILWIIQELLRHFKFSKRNIRENAFLVVFVMVATISIIMPLFHNGKIIVMNVDGVVEKLKFSASNITQLIYLWFSIVFYFTLYAYCKRKELSERDKMVNFYLIGAFAVCLVTVYQIIAFRYRMPFDIIFRQNMHGTIQGNRIYGPCLEASMLCYYLVTIFPIIVHGNTKIWKYCLLLLSDIIGLYSYSSSFLGGMSVWLVLEAIYYLYKHKNRIRGKKLIIAFFSTIAIIFLVIINMEYITAAFEKLSNTINANNVSGIRRQEAFLLQMQAFMKSSLLGIGFGSCRAKDLFSTWLSCLGIIGFTPILIFLLKGFFAKTNDIGMKFSNIILWIVMFIGVSEPYNLFVWFLLSQLILNKQNYNRMRAIDKLHY